jgi:hypothetical protein
VLSLCLPLFTARLRDGQRIPGHPQMFDNFYKGFLIIRDMDDEGNELYTVQIKGETEHLLDCNTKAQAFQLIDDILLAAHSRALGSRFCA